MHGFPIPISAFRDFGKWCMFHIWNNAGRAAFQAPPRRKPFAQEGLFLTKTKEATIANTAIARTTAAIATVEEIPSSDR